MTIVFLKYYGIMFKLVIQNMVNMIVYSPMFSHLQKLYLKTIHINIHFTDPKDSYLFFIHFKGEAKGIKWTVILTASKYMNVE